MLKLSVLTLLMTLGIAGAQPETGGERIVQRPLDGFVSAHRQQAPQASIEEFVPQGETVQRWTRMVTIMRRTGVASRLAPLDYAHQFVAGLPASCPGAEVRAPEAIQISNRPAARTLARCPLNPQTGLPESFYMFAIAGAADMHIVQVAFRRVPTEAALDFAAEQLASVQFCAAVSAEPACR